MTKKKNLSQRMAKKGMKLRTWAKSKGLSDKDIEILNQISGGYLQGKWGRAKELRELLEQSGFEIA